jgi:toxin-antitoxin system PIN domain toxin
VIIPDINLLVYAYNSDAPFHETARRWWEDALSGGEPVGLPWPVLHGYLRIMTHPRVLERPLAPADALRHLRQWTAVPACRIVEPGAEHLAILAALLEETGAAGSLTTDAVLAALAIEYQAELYSNDTDFARFSGLRLRNPLRGRSR